MPLPISGYPLPEPKKPELAFEEKTYFEVDYSDLDDFLIEVYGNKKIESVCMEEWSNYMSRDMTVSDKPLQEYEQRKVDKIKAGEYVDGCIGALLDDCCVNGLIPPGRYLIKVYW